MSRRDGGIGKADPWPTNDTPIVEQNPSPHQSDGYDNRLPLGGHQEGGSDYWLDQLIYPNRPQMATGMPTDRADLAGRNFYVSPGNLTGRKVGPSTD